jgi:NAD(P)-dependent dehydrogenase (short-subunit alcohol dehydrogenase family)
MRYGENTVTLSLMFCCTMVLILAVLVVGVSPESIGSWMVTSIAQHHPALLILASRTRSKIDEVISGARRVAPHVHIEAVTVDLSFQTSVRAAAQEILDLAPKLDIVINHAGVNVMHHQLTPEGIEMHFGTNHIGLFLLTNLILEKIRKGAIEAAQKGSTRIINV